MQWKVKRFKELSNTELYQILKLRSDVFVVEQNCAYPDLDDKDLDPNALHLFNSTDPVSAYLRILPPDCSYPNQTSLGRVVTAETQRGSGVGHQLVKKANQLIDSHWPNHTCHISAQAYLIEFYRQHQFETVGQSYLEDDIPHIGMQRLAVNNRSK